MGNLSEFQRRNESISRIAPSHDLRSLVLLYRSSFEGRAG